MKILIAGYGSIGQKHYRILSKIKREKKIAFFSSQKKLKISHLKTYNQIISFNPDYIVVALRTSEHYGFVKFLEKKFKNKKILIEKPIFDKSYSIKLKNNYYFVGYNLRFHPIINFIKKKKFKPIYVKVNCYSYLPNWRKNIPYYLSNSADKKGGGVLLELSHEIDYLTWIFGDFEILFSLSKKISNLKIKSDDILILCLKSKKLGFILNLNINFFSRIEKREIQIDTKKDSYKFDLIKNSINYYDGKKSKKIKQRKFRLDKTYHIQHQSILSKNNKRICSTKEALKTLKFLEKIR